MRYFKMRRSFLSRIIVFSIGILAPTVLCRTRKKQNLLTSLKRIQEARKILQHMFVDYNNISKGGGDNVRSYLGTVG